MTTANRQVEERASVGMREVCFLIGRGGAILWSDVSASPVALPDSRQRWLAVWDHRDELEEIAHSHPVGPAAFSAEDETTMAALTVALGKAVRFSVVAPSTVIVRQGDRDVELAEPPWWAPLMRAASGMLEANGAD